MNAPSISIVMAYYNRLPQLRLTLSTIRMSSLFPECEIIVVDDASSPDHDPRLLAGNGIRVLRIDSGRKKHVNPCVAFNAGFSVARGKIIVIQNPECAHAGDVLLSIREELESRSFMAMGCYSASRASTDRALAAYEASADPRIAMINAISPIRNVGASFDFEDAWYNHTKYRDVGYHFCAGIPCEDLARICGFDLRYARGHAYDDNDILTRMRRAGMRTWTKDEPFTVHLWHEKGSPGGPPNRDLYDKTTLIETGFEANGGRYLTSEYEGIYEEISPGV